jgi:hypothetical protein
MVFTRSRATVQLKRYVRRQTQLFVDPQIAIADAVVAPRPIPTLIGAALDLELRQPNGERPAPPG